MSHLHELDNLYVLMIHLKLYNKLCNIIRYNNKMSLWDTYKINHFISF